MDKVKRDYVIINKDWFDYYRLSTIRRKLTRINYRFT